MGYFGENADKLNSVQLIVRGRAFVVPVGEGTIAFWWKTMGGKPVTPGEAAAVLAERQRR